MKTFNDIFVPSLLDNVSFSEINTSQQLRLSKALIASDVYKKEFIQTIIHVLEENIHTKNIDIINDLNLHDVIVIFTGLHCISESNIVKMKITCNKCKNVHSLSIDLNKIYDKLCLVTPKEVRIDNSCIIKIPSIKKELDYINMSKNVFRNPVNRNKTQHIGLLNIWRFIESNNIIKKSFEDIVNENEIKLKNIFDGIKQIMSIYNDVYVYKFKCVGDCNVTYNKRLSLNTTKYYNFFNYLYHRNNILSIYKDIYHLSKIGLDPQYINSISGFERNVYWNLYGKEIEKKKNILQSKRK